MGAKRKAADPKTAVKSKAKAKNAPAAPAAAEPSKPTREVTSGFLTGLKYKSLHGKGAEKTNAQQLLQAREFGFRGFVRVIWMGGRVLCVCRVWLRSFVVGGLGVCELGTIYYLYTIYILSIYLYTIYILSIYYLYTIYLSICLHIYIIYVCIIYSTLLYIVYTVHILYVHYIN